MSTENLTSAPSEALPNRPRTDFTRPPVWSLEESPGAQLAPLPAKCARHDRADGICCKELKGDDERTLIDPDVVRDVYVLFFLLSLCRSPRI